MNHTIVLQTVRLGLPLLLCCSVEASEFFAIENTAFTSHVSADGTTVLLQDNNSSSLWTPRTGTVKMLPDGFEGRGISGDGSTVVGTVTHPFEDEAVRWTEETGMVSLGIGDISAQDVSLDGSIVVGHYRAPQAMNPDPYRWTESSGIVGIDTTVPSFIFGTGIPTVVSADGSVIAGRAFGDLLWGAYRWTEETGMVDLGEVPGKPSITVSAISADGSTVVGNAQGPLPLSGIDHPSEAMRWSEETGMVGLGVLPGRTISFANAVSTDGELVLGSSRGDDRSDRELFAWTEATGMVSLTDILVAEVGVRPELAETALVWDMSADQRTIVGRSGGQHWAIVLDDPLRDLLVTVPEPTSACLAMLGIFGVISFRGCRGSASRQGSCNSLLQPNRSS